MKRIIVYYSQGGKTDLVAKTLAKNLNASLVRIHDLKNREGFKNRLLSSISAIREEKTDIVWWSFLKIDQAMFLKPWNYRIVSEEIGKGISESTAINL